MDKKTILIIEDEIAISDMLEMSLTAQGFSTMAANDVSEAKAHLHKKLPDLILLDWMLPGCNGINFIKQLKANELWQDIPVIMLTARAEEASKVTGLEVGADDYVTKPFSPKELVARIQTVLRRGPLLQPDHQVHVKGLKLDTKQHLAHANDNLLELTGNEYNVLHFFMTHPNRVYSREQLLGHIWGPSHYIDERTVDVQIKRLRHKLKPYDYHQHIKTIRGSGYQFVTELP